MKKNTTFLAFLTLIAALSTAHAQYTPVEDLTYTIVSNQVTITGGNANITNLSIPPTIEGFPVTRIDDYAFYYSSNISVVLPTSVTHIGVEAFFGSGIESIEMPGVIHVDDDAFSGCDSLTTLTLPASLESIGIAAFSGCDSLTTISLPASLESIDEDAFGDCTSLTSFSVASGNPNFASLDGVLFNKAITELLQYTIGNPATIYTIPQDVRTVSNNAFQDCTSLTSVTFPASLESIGENAFSGCTSLTSFSVASDNPNFASLDGVLFNKAITELRLLAVSHRQSC